LKFTNALPEDWFCTCCVDNKLGKLHNGGPDFISKSVATRASADHVKDHHAIEHAATIMVAKDEEVKRNMGGESWGSHSTVTEKQAQEPHQKILTVGATQTTLVDISTLTQGTPKP
jgi:hypothetical protein